MLSPRIVVCVYHSIYSTDRRHHFYFFTSGVDPGRLDVLRTLNPKYVGSTPTSSSSLLFYSLCSVLRIFIVHGIQTRFMSSNAIRHLLRWSAYQDVPSLLHAGYYHCILFVFWHFCFAFSTDILFLFSVVITKTVSSRFKNHEIHWKQYLQGLSFFGVNKK